MFNLDQKTLAFWGEKFFPHLIEPYRVLALCAIAFNRR